MWKHHFRRPMRNTDHMLGARRLTSNHSLIIKLQSNSDLGRGSDNFRRLTHRSPGRLPGQHAETIHDDKLGLEDLIYLQ